MSPFLRFLLGFGLGLLTFFPMPKEGFWFDEVYTASLTTDPKKPLGELVVKTIKDDTHPPLAYLPYWAYARLLGLSSEDGPVPEPTFRALSGLFGAAGVGLLSTVHPVAGLLLAGSHAYALKGREARHYAFLGLLLLLALWALQRGLYEPWVWASALALWTHALAVFPTLAMGLALLIQAGFREALFRAGALLTLASFPLLVNALKAREAKDISSLTVFPPSSILHLPEHAFGNTWGWFLFALGLLGALWALKREGKRGVVLLVPHLTLFLWFLAAHLLSASFYSPRYAGAFAPLLLFPVAHLLKALPRIAYPLALAGLLAWLPIRLDPPTPGGEPNREAAWILQKAPTGTVLVNEEGRLLTLRYYYRGKTELVLVKDLEEALKEIERRKGPIYLYLWENPLIGGDLLHQELSARYRLRQITPSGNGLALYRVEKGWR